MRTPAERAADEAVERVARPLTDAEKTEALVAVGETAELLTTFTTDDVPFAFSEDVDSRAAGYVMRAAARMGFITPTDEWRKSDNVSCHARPKRVWKSQLQ